MKLSYRRPVGADPYKVVEYIIKYRKLGSRDWKFTNETRSLRQIVSGLDTDTPYEFRVLAWYQGESSIVESGSAVIETDGSKWALLNFPYSVSEVKLLFSARQHICYITPYDIARPTICPSVTQSKTVEVRITQPSPQVAP